MKKPELLAPAGNMDSLRAAICAGCDAVYLSGKKYGARSFASNFSNDELVHAILYAHLYGVRVYVTVNTIIYEDEVDDFLDYIDFLHRSNVDAVIMQDIGMVDLVRKVYPNLEIHISTQMHVHNLDGVKFFEKLGLPRVVLARETSLDDIKNIKANSNVELEVFVHGALCISYSGQCLMSSLIGGRSGNRGSCAGCCRLPYDLVSDGSVVNKDKYLLSTKDLMTLDCIGDLIDAGIDSFKIEGRMKRPNYVYMMVSLYHKAIDSYIKTGRVLISDDDIKNMKLMFNRGFTNGYLFNEKYIVNQKRPNHMGVVIGSVVHYKNGFVFIKLSDVLNLHDGIRIIDSSDVGFIVNQFYIDGHLVNTASAGEIVSIKSDFVRKGSVVVKTTDYNLMKSIDSAIEANDRKVSISGVVRLKVNGFAQIDINDGVNFVSVRGDKVMAALKRPLDKEQVIKQINRLGDTVFSFDKLEVLMDDNVFLPVSSLNNLRRLAIEKLMAKRLYNTNYYKSSYDISVKDFDRESSYSCLVSNNDFDLFKYKYIYTDNYDLVNDDIFYKVPRVNYSYRDFDSRVLVGEYGSLLRYKLFDTDFSFNVVNSYSVAFLHSIGALKVTLSYELDLYQVKNIIDAYHERYNKHPNLEVIINAREEVMVSRFNLLSYYGVNNGSLRDRFNNLYPIKIKDDLMYIYNYRIRDLCPFDYFKIGVNVVRINY